MNLAEPVAPLSAWALDPDVEHLNHGSYGGCPRAVLDAAIAFKTRLEAAPMKFFVLDWQDELDRARTALARWVQTSPDRLTFTPNATTGVATALGALASTLTAGDELLVTDHGYRAIRNQLLRICDERGTRLVTVQLPLPFDSAAAVAAIERAVTPRTRLCILDHITSPTALVLPLAQLVPMLAARGIAVVIDGAHGPGQLELDVDALLAAGASYYAGNNHKWLCAPKGSGFLAIAADARAPLPVVTSHGASPEYGPENRLHAQLDWMGTYEPSSQLAVTAAIGTVGRMAGSWSSAISRNHALAVAMSERLAQQLDADALGPADSIGSMAALAIDIPAGTTTLDLQKQLLRDGWEIPIVAFVHGPLVRISAHLYNHVDQVDALTERLRALGIRGRRLR